MTRPHKRPQWTPSEDAILLANYATKGAHDCLPLLPGRDINGLYQRARKFGLRSPRIKNTRRVYAPDERIDDAIRAAARHGNRRGDWLKLSKRFNRSQCYLSRRARELGVTTAKVFERQWDANETELLHDTAHLRPAAAAAVFKRRGYTRTPAAIVRKRHLLSVDPIPYGRYTGRALADMLGQGVATIHRAIHNGELRARRDRDDSHEHFHITDADVRAFFKAHPLRLDLRRVPPANVPWLIDVLTENQR